MSRKRNNRSRATRQSKQARPVVTHAPTPQVEADETAVEEVLPNESTDTPQEEDTSPIVAEASTDEASHDVPIAASTPNDDVSSEVVYEETLAGETTNEVPEELATPEEVKDAASEEEVVEADDLDGSSSLDDDDLPATEFEEDDEEYLSSDKVIHQEKNLAIVQQMDNVVSWELVNLYKENGKVANKYVLRGSPPVFKVSSTSGAVAEFMVTKELASTLEEVFGDVRKAYYGIDPTIKKNSFGQKTLKEKANSAVEWAQDNPFKAVVAALIALFFVISPFLY